MVTASIPTLASALQLTLDSHVLTPCARLAATMVEFAMPQITAHVLPISLETPATRQFAIRPAKIAEHACKAPVSTTAHALPTIPEQLVLSQSALAAVETDFARLLECAAAILDGRAPRAAPQFAPMAVGTVAA